MTSTIVHYHIVSPTTPKNRSSQVWPIPRSLAATYGVSFDFLSCRYLDVSVPCVGPPCGVICLCILGFPIRVSLDHRVLARSPKLIAGSCALHRLLLPRHPPYALCSFYTQSARSKSLKLQCIDTASTIPFLFTISKEHLGLDIRQGQSLKNK